MPQACCHEIARAVLFLQVQLVLSSTDGAGAPPLNTGTGPFGVKQGAPKPLHDDSAPLQTMPPCTLRSMGAKAGWGGDNVCLFKCSNDNRMILPPRIPELAEFLVLHGPCLGSIASEWFAPGSGLKAIYMIGGMGVTGTIPQTLKHVTKLRYLRLHNMGFDGSLPDAFGSFRALKSLEIMNNRWLTGSLPRSLGAMLAMEHLTIGGTSISGSMPREMFRQGNSLQTFDLNRNRITGSIPGSVGLLTHLRHFIAFENCAYNADERAQFESNLAKGSNAPVPPMPFSAPSAAPWPPRLSPRSPHKCRRFTRVITDGVGNDGFPHDRDWCCPPFGLTGSLPQAMSQLPVLKRLWLDENDISGAVPAWLGNLPSLTSIDLFANNLSGDLPLQDLAKLTNLRQFRFENNPQLSGTISDAFLDGLPHLKRWDFQFDPLVKFSGMKKPSFKAEGWDPEASRRLRGD